MEKTDYKNFEEINRELKILQLERQIVAEELYSLGMEVKESFMPHHIFTAVLRGFRDFGIYYIIKRLLK